jgi:hypothetical protein
MQLQSHLLSGSESFLLAQKQQPLKLQQPSSQLML